MSKKISKKASAIRTISLAVGSFSLLLIAISHITNKEACIRAITITENQTITS